MADKQKIVYWSKKLLKTSSSSSSLDLSRSGNDWIRCSSSAKERFTTDTKLKTVSVRSANVANHVPCKHVFVCVSLLKDCFSFVFKWTVNEFDVSVETLAIRESTLASIPCQGLTLNWRAAVKKKKDSYSETDFSNLYRASWSWSHGAQWVDNATIGRRRRETLQ